MRHLTSLKRWTAFNAVGAAGVAVQLGVLAGLVRGAHLSPLVATVVAVEAAVLHNFFWHQRWTWRDRPASGSDLVHRLLQFQLLNGVVSLGGNLAIMALLAGALQVDPVLANVVGIVACSLVNFAASDRLVFAAPKLGELKVALKK
jgi:putative flippase GtrA